MLIIQYSDQELEKFERILMRGLVSKRTLKGHLNNLRRFLLEFDGVEVDTEAIQSYLSKFKNRNTYRNHLSTLRVYFREALDREDLVKSFKFPRIAVMPKLIPSKKEIQEFYSALEGARDRALFLMYASSGLRRKEVLNIRMDEVDFARRMLMPKAEGETKRAWVSFYNSEAEEALNEYLKARSGNSKRLFPHAESEVKKVWNDAREKTGLNITPQVLREWFAQEMSNLGVPDRYIDAFCGRMPRTVLARHYTDYSPQRLKEVYDRAGLRILA
ncbi:MAG: tyrosine-type recombinase/integrase [Candidatus Methanosuratincola petrocarbonis]